MGVVPTELALALGPNPTRGDLLVEFALPRDAVARVTVIPENRLVPPSIAR